MQDDSRWPMATPPFVVAPHRIPVRRASLPWVYQPALARRPATAVGTRKGAIL